MICAGGGAAYLSIVFAYVGRRAYSARRFVFATWSRATRRRFAMFVVLGASGNTGKVVAETLLRQKKTTASF